MNFNISKMIYRKEKCDITKIQIYEIMGLVSIFLRAKRPYRPGAKRNGCIPISCHFPLPEFG